MSLARHTAHSVRNADKDVQKTRGRKRTGPLSDAEEATRALALQARQANKAALTKDIDEFTAQRDSTIHDLAQKYHKKEEYIRALVLHETQYTKTRAPSLRNAVIHDLSEKAKQAGNTLKLPDLQKGADEVLVKGVSAEEKARLLAAHRQLSTKGLRATHVGATVDARNVASQIQDELMNLYECTGTRGNLDDVFMPTFAGSGDAIAFCAEVLKMPAIDILRCFEQWALTREAGLPERNDRRSVHAQIASAMEKGLQDITQNESIKMSHTHFKVDIALAWKVKVVGWPEDVVFQNPSRMAHLASLRRIRDDLRAGLIYWETLTVPEARAVHDEVEAIRAANNGQVKPRKPRGDIGGKHVSAGRCEREEESDRDHDYNDNDNDDLEGDGYGDNDDVRATCDTDLVVIPCAPLADATNAAAANTTNAATASAAATPAPTAQKRRALTQGGAAAKKARPQNTPASASAPTALKPRKVRKDKGVPRGPKGSKVSAAPSTSGGPGRDDEVTRAARQKMAQRRAAAAASSLAAQLPPTV
ncbi:hypothetical protein B0H16DRAFT_1716423 [Mycena metata]|uniref:Uncharacterized protein n=1 Tax=Mycena metata TaxID=1033252 RepID=A0AAD7JQQ8_9AGAR|nr:hypothetical protein B0H16DRAFT_1716423 [Mycena metata]